MRKIIEVIDGYLTNNSIRSEIDVKFGYKAWVFPHIYLDKIHDNCSLVRVTFEYLKDNKKK